MGGGGIHCRPRRMCVPSSLVRYDTHQAHRPWLVRAHLPRAHQTQCLAVGPPHFPGGFPTSAVASDVLGGGYRGHLVAILVRVALRITEESAAYAADKCDMLHTTVHGQLESIIQVVSHDHTMDDGAPQSPMFAKGGGNTLHQFRTNHVPSPSLVVPHPREDGPPPPPGGWSPSDGPPPPPLGDHTPTTVHAHLQAQKLQHKTKEFSICITVL